MSKRPPSVRGAVVRFAAVSLLVVMLVAAAGLWALRSIGRSEAVTQAREVARLAGQGIVEPALTDGLLRADPVALADLDELAQGRVPGDAIIRVRLWTPDGRIVYSGDPRLVGRRFPLESDVVGVVDTGTPIAEVSDLSAAENALDPGGRRGAGGLPTPAHRERRAAHLRDLPGPRVREPHGGPPAGGARACRARRGPGAVDRAAAPGLAPGPARPGRPPRPGGPAAAGGGGLGRRAAPDRRRPARRARAGGADAGVVSSVREGASSARRSMRALRSLLVDIHPPTPRSEGLGSAPRDVGEPLRAAGAEVTLDVPVDLPVAPEVETLLFRVAREALRNAAQHAHARSVSVRVTVRGDTVRMVVEDDGIGSSAAERAARREDGHMGLRLLEELVAERGGALEVVSQAGEGTRVTAEVPAR